MRLTVAGVVLASLPIVLGAEDRPSLHEGARVRVTVADPKTRTLTGSLEALRDRSLLLGIDGRHQAVSLEHVQRVELSHGRRVSKTRTALGAVVGGVTGALVGGCLANKDDYGVACAGQNDTKYVIGGIAGGLVGGALGAWLGRSERWEEAELSWVPSPVARAASARPHAHRAGPPAPTH